MIAKFREYLNTRPFRSFFIVTSGGNRYAVPTPEHAAIDPKGTSVIIWTDSGGAAIVAGLHIVAIETETAAAA